MIIVRDIYGATTYGDDFNMLDRDLKRGSTEMLIMAMVEDRPRHGYEIGKLIEQRSEGILQFHVASLYPLLYRLEKRGLIKGRWVEKPGERRRRFYTLTSAGRKILAEQRRTWKDFFAALDRVAGINPA
jgi:PadR family transcriptional regulator, regulatory protein PadR